jgi:hypothetical protein
MLYNFLWPESCALEGYIQLTTATESHLRIKMVTEVESVAKATTGHGEDL